MQERDFDFFIFYFLWIFERRYPHIESIFCGRSTSQTRGKGGACLMIIFHQFFLPDLYYYPTSSNLAKITRAYHQSEILPLPSWGGHGVGQSRKRRDGER